MASDNIIIDASIRRDVVNGAGKGEGRGAGRGGERGASKGSG